MNTRTPRTLARVTASALLLTLVAAGCSNDDTADDDTEMTMEVTDPTVATTTPTTAVESDGAEASTRDDIVDVAVGAGSFETLVAAVQAAGLEDTLRGDGPFTVFAPTDDAFAALPEGTIDALLADPSGDLTSILTYHVLPAKVLATDVVQLDGEKVATVNGAELTVGVTDDGVTLTDAAGNTVNVVTTDVEASNGVIHVIDGVLLPG